MNRTIALLIAVIGLAPSPARGQGAYSTDKDGCIVGRPCAYGIPQAPPQGAYSVDADGCVVGQPCPWRGWKTEKRTADTETIDERSGNRYSKHRNPDGTTDVYGSNTNTGSQWEKHLDPAHGVQSDHNKRGEVSVERLAPPFGRPQAFAPNFEPSFAPDATPTVAFEPSIHDRQIERSQNLNGRIGVTREPRAGHRVAGGGTAVTESTADAEQQEAWERFVREQQSEHERLAGLGVVLSNMDSQSLVTAARTAARQRCATEPGEAERAACLQQADRK